MVQHLVYHIRTDKWEDHELVVHSQATDGEFDNLWLLMPLPPAPSISKYPFPSNFWIDGQGNSFDRVSTSIVVAFAPVSRHAVVRELSSA